MGSSIQLSSMLLLLALIRCGASTCSEVLEQKLPDLWLSSGPPISYGDAAACDAHGTLKRVSLQCGWVNDKVAKFLLTKLDGDTAEMEGLLRQRYISEFTMCVPPACAGAGASRLSVALLLLLYGHGLQSGRELRDGALELQRQVDAAAMKCISIEESPLEIQLPSGFAMPLIFFGAAASAKSSELVAAALQLGFRGFDSATKPVNGEGFDYDQEALGRALATSSRPRKELFLTSKVHPAELGYRQTLGAVERALGQLGPAAQGYIDLFLIHFPTCDRDFCPPGGALRPLGTFEDSWRALEECVRRGWLRSIGVSNFDAQQLQQLLKMAEILPAVVGVWADIFHPVPRSLRRICEQHAIQIQVYGVLGYEWSQGRGFSGKLAVRESPLLAHPVLRNIAQAKGLQSMDVAVKYFLQQGISVILRSSRRERMLEAYSTAQTPELSADEMEALLDLDGFLSSNLRVHASPDFYAGMAGFDTSQLQDLQAQSLEISPEECSLARASFLETGVSHLPKSLPTAVLKSAQRAAEKAVRDHGGDAWESKVNFPKALCDVMEITIDKFHLTELAYFFPLMAYLQRLATCVLDLKDFQDPGVFYMHLRPKVPGCNASDVPWHQDMRYCLSFTTKQRTYVEAESDILDFAQRAAVFHIPLTTESYRKGALMYALGSHHDGLDPNFWAKGWLAGEEPPSYPFSEAHEAVRVLETEAGDALGHSLLVHHGTRPNDTPEVRWHVEVGVLDMTYPIKADAPIMPLPEGTSMTSLAQYLQEMQNFIQGFLHYAEA